ncbi:hypothetical protein DYQ86_22330 [Acidobacteria bacterium AB60]|nr:hypothetical protein DYQ86_22330 [Acidobacteria bacterium AB60]
MKHSRMFSLAGAVLVLATFVVKEVIEDRMRDKIDTLDGVERHYALQARSTSTQVEEISVEQAIDLPDLSDSAVNRRPFIRYVDSAMFISGLARAHIEDTRAMNDGTSEVLLNIPGAFDENEDHADLADTRHRLTLDEDSRHYRMVDALDETKNTLLEGHMKDRFLPQFLPDDLRDEIQQYRYQVSQVYLDVLESYSGSIDDREVAINYLRLYRESLSQRSRRISEIGYGFYGLGWLINLAGGLLGNRIAAEE